MMGGERVNEVTLQHSVKYFTDILVAISIDGADWVVEELCGDCTKATPCCGYGPCNIFCCNCDKGCRGVGNDFCRNCPSDSSPKCKDESPVVERPPPADGEDFAAARAI
uniref:Uncharacterized protein n=1 Tax=Romanomermis culicivorax TaxID=13658 RepID=A0A915LBK4_ROMCU